MGSRRRRFGAGASVTGPEAAHDSCSAAAADGDGHREATGTATSPGAPVVLRLNPRLLLRGACTVIAGIVTLSIAFELVLDTRTGTWWRVFSVGSEANLATLYSVLLLAASATAALLAGYASWRRGLPWARHWFAVAVLLALVAVDEEIGLHETVSNRLESAWHTGGVFTYAWVVPGLVVVVVLATVFLPFVLALPRPIRSLVVVAALVYVAGALGFEMIGGWFVDDREATATAVVVASTIEETLELLGVALMGYAVTRFVVEHLEPISLTTAPASERAAT